MAGQADEPVGRGRQRLENGLVQPDPNGELYDQRAQTPYRINAVLLVHPHGFLRYPLPVLGVALLYLLYPRLKLGHCLQLAALSHRQRKHGQPHGYREYEDAQAKAVEKGAV